MRQWIGSALVQIVACRLFYPILYLNQCWYIVNWTLRDKNEIFSKKQILSFRKMHLKISSAKLWPFCPGRDELRSELGHYCDVIMGATASQIINLTIVYSTVHSGADQRKHWSSASMTFVRGIHRSPVISPHRWPVTRKMFPFDDVIMR